MGLVSELQRGCRRALSDRYLLATRTIHSTTGPSARGVGRRGSKGSDLPALRDTEENQVLPGQQATSDDPWVAVRDKESGGIYWWNKQNDQVTAVGDPKPLTPVLPPRAPLTPYQMHQQVRDQVPLSEALKHNLVMGLGVGFAFALVAAIFR